jgi:hypothetical protein
MILMGGRGVTSSGDRWRDFKRCGGWLSSTVLRYPCFRLVFWEFLVQHWRVSVCWLHLVSFNCLTRESI